MEDDLAPYHGSHFKHTAPPVSSWSFGDGIDSSEQGKKWLAGEESGWTGFDATKEAPGVFYKLLTSGIVPRPVAFVSSVSEAGMKNLAPFSWFNTVTHNPPIISISCSVIAGKSKDTALNIKETQGFTVNIISETWIHNANACSIDAPRDVGEWPISGLTPAETVHVKAPRVKESAFSMECELFQAIDIVHPETGETTATLILGRVKYIHVRNDVLTDKRDAVNPTQLRPILRLGDITYAVLGDGFRVPRPSWKDEGEGLQASGILSVHDGKL